MSARRINGPADVRFWAKVDKRGAVPQCNPQLQECWEWTASIGPDGYGMFKMNGRAHKAHRISYGFTHGLIPDDKCIDHRCRNRACVRPDHLRLVSKGQNSQHRDLDKHNSSGYRGVSWHKASETWAVYATCAGKRVFGGYFADIDDANRAARALRNSLFTHNDLDRIAQ